MSYYTHILKLKYVFFFLLYHFHSPSDVKRKDLVQRKLISTSHALKQIKKRITANAVVFGETDLNDTTT